MEVNWLAVLVSAVLAWGIGALWYGPLFGKTWQKEVGMTDEDLKGANMAMIFGTSFVLMAIMIFALTFIMNAHTDEKDFNFMHGAFHGMMAGIFYIATSMGINYLYQRKSIKLWLIDAGYQILFLALAGGILMVWR